MHRATGGLLAGLLLLLMIATTAAAYTFEQPDLGGGDGGGLFDWVFGHTADAADKGLDGEFHRPIKITGEADLVGFAGVRNPEAAGTAEDPYVISGWKIPPVYVAPFNLDKRICQDLDIYSSYYRPAISIRNVDAHIVIRNNVFEPLDPLSSDPREVALAACGTSSGPPAIRLEDTANVVIEDNRFRKVDGAIHAHYADRVQITQNVFRDLTHQGISFWAGSDLFIKNNRFESGSAQAQGDAVHLDATERVTIEGNRFATQPYDGVYVDMSPDVAIRSNEFIGAGGAGIAMERSPGATVTDNLIDGSGWHGIWISSSKDVEIHRNDLLDNGGRDVYNDDRPLVDATNNHWGEEVDYYGNVDASDARSSAFGAGPDGTTGPDGEEYEGGTGDAIHDQMEDPAGNGTSGDLDQVVSDTEETTSDTTGTLEDSTNTTSDDTLLGDTSLT